MDKLLKELLEVPGVTGREDRIREVAARTMARHVDELRTDFMGNLIAVRRPRSKRRARKTAKSRGPLRIMVAAHMDQIGLYVRHLDPKTGFVRFVTAGGFDPKTLIAQRVLVHGQRDLPGVIGTKPIHVLKDEERRRPVSLDQLYVDVGLAPNKVQELVAPGDPISLVGPAQEVGDCYVSRALDDRIGLYVMLRALEKLAKSKRGHESELYLVATVQEEVGLRGALTAAFGVDPHIALAVDVTLACDVPGVASHEQGTQLGRGVSITLMNGASISHPRLVSRLKALAEAKAIAYQVDVLPRGGTDAGAMQRARAGAAVATISVPARYVHTTVEMVHRDDVESAVRLLTAFLQEGPGPEDYLPTLPKV